MLVVMVVCALERQTQDEGGATPRDVAGAEEAALLLRQIMGEVQPDALPGRAGTARTPLEESGAQRRFHAGAVQGCEYDLMKS